VLGLRFRVKRLGNWCFPPPITPPPPRGRGRIYSESPLPFGKGGEIKRGGDGIKSYSPSLTSTKLSNFMELKSKYFLLF